MAVERTCGVGMTLLPSKMGLKMTHGNGSWKNVQISSGNLFVKRKITWRAC
jgi:hypothetical protein